MPTLNIPAPTIIVEVDPDGTTRLNGVSLTPAEAGEAANFITINQPGYVAPVPDEPEPAVIV